MTLWNWCLDGIRSAAKLHFCRCYAICKGQAMPEAQPCDDGSSLGTEAHHLGEMTGVGIGRYVDNVTA